MRRPVLITVAVLGILVALIGGTGLFAALTDTARTGTNTVDSAALAASADIRLANATRDGGGPITCGAYSDNLASGFFTVADVGPGWPGQTAHFCIKNVGSQNVGIWPRADELTDTDTDCTGDEALYDTTCGGNTAGELSNVLFTSYTWWNDCSATGGSGASIKLADNTVAPAVGLGSLAPGAVACLTASILYAGTAPSEDIQKAQSDRSTWRYAFRADVLP